MNVLQLHHNEKNHSYREYGFVVRKSHVFYANFYDLVDLVLMHLINTKPSHIIHVPTVLFDPPQTISKTKACC